MRAEISLLASWRIIASWGVLAASAYIRSQLVEKSSTKISVSPFSACFAKKTALAVAGQFWRVFCIVFIKGIVFFFGHFRHSYLLYFE